MMDEAISETFLRLASDSAKNGVPEMHLIEQGGEELFMFSSDYPHTEGTRDPIRRFEDTMPQVSDAARSRFYADNFLEMIGAA